MDETSSRKPERRRAARPVTAEWLFRAAAHYLERYASSTRNLERVLTRKVARRAGALGEDPAVHAPLIAATVTRFVELKLVDDRSFAEGRLASLRRKGTSARMAAAKLAEKGVERGMVETVMEADGTSEREAAFRYARRRRLGPHRLRDRAERRDRDVAAMVRAGFAYPLAVMAVDATGGEEEYLHGLGDEGPAGS